MSKIATSVCLLTALLFASSALADHHEQNGVYSVKVDSEGVDVDRGEKRITRYRFQSGPKPVLWPLVGPHGLEMTRGYPMRDATPEERDDHVHHRSLWLTHGEVNGVDYWAETEGHGRIEHQELVRATGGKEATLKTRNQWVAPNGEAVLADDRTLVFSHRGESEIIDFTATLTALDEAVNFGDTKEGTFGIRVPGTMKVDADKGGKIVSSNGDVNKEAWGKKADWVDYAGPVEGKTVGITIMNHPSSFGAPCRWHVRTYGLFAANPFGVFHFTGGEKTEGFTLPAGESITLKYRVVLHPGTTEETDIDAFWKDYAGK